MKELFLNSRIWLFSLFCNRELGTELSKLQKILFEHQTILKSFFTLDVKMNTSHDKAIQHFDFR